MKTLEKRWVIDCDDMMEPSPMMMSHIEYHCKPITQVEFDEAGVPVGVPNRKIEAIIPTKNGHHLITKKFDVMEFKKNYPDIDIQKKNPTLIYYPNSLN